MSGGRFEAETFPQHRDADDCEEVDAVRSVRFAVPRRLEIRLRSEFSAPEFCRRWTPLIRIDSLYDLSYPSQDVREHSCGLRDRFVTLPL